MIEKLKQLTPYYGIYTYWKDEINKLEKTDYHLRIADLDYTIFSRDEQLEKQEGLAENRGDKGTRMMINEVSIEKFCSRFYKGKKYPTEIVGKMNPKHDLILSHGFFELQQARLNYLGLHDLKIITTDEAADKIIETIRYVIFQLKFIPSKITIYEDRPKYFIEYRDLLEDVLGCEIEIMYVEMNGNDGYKKIEKI